MVRYYSAKNVEDLNNIRVFNVISNNDLIKINLEELTELAQLEAKYINGDEIPKEELLEELVDVLNTTYNVLGHYYRTDEVKKVINKKIKKAKDILEIR